MLGGYATGAETKKTLKMKSVKIEGKRRSELGKKATRQLRSEGQVPAVIYGGKETIHFTAPAIALRSLVYTPDFQLANITVDGKDYRTIMKDLQFDVVTDELSHVDFMELVEDRKVNANLPIKFHGQPQGVKDGGRLELKIKSLSVRTYPKYLAEHINVNIDDLQLHGNIRVEDVKVDNVEILNSPRIPIASVVTTRELRQEDTAAATTAAATTPAAGAAAAPAAGAKAPADKDKDKEKGKGKK
jgi:large subunit ribosomal protein L25